MGEFTDSVCTQKWIMTKHEVTGAGRLREEGEIKLDEAIDVVEGPAEEYDDSGNKIDIKRSKVMEPKDIKKAITLTEEETWELGDKLAELKTALEGATMKT